MTRIFDPLPELAKRKVWAVQEFTLLGVRAIRNLFSRPRYLADTLIQMDITNYQPADCPLCKAGSTPVKPGSRGLRS